MEAAICAAQWPRATYTGSTAEFNLRAATRVAANDKHGRLALCKYILRPPLANDRLKILDDNVVRLEFKKPWSDGTTSVELAPLALIARLAALVPPPKRHLAGYFGVLSSHGSLRSMWVPAPVPESTPQQEDKSPRTLPLAHYISWSELRRRTFEIDTICPRCKSPLCLIVPIKTDDTIKKILSAMGLPTEAPKLWPARPPPSQSGGEGGDISSASPASRRLDLEHVAPGLVGAIRFHARPEDEPR